MRILFLAPRLGGVSPGRQLATFHDVDVQLLRDLGHEVDVFPWSGFHPIELQRRASESDLIYIWTVGDHTTAAIISGYLLQNPVVVVIGGYEFANLPDISYGNLTRWRGRRWSHLAWKHADALLFVDPSLKGEGERAFGPRAKPSFVIPTGYDASYWRPDGEKEDMVLTVAHAPGTPNLSLKGVDRFLAAAKGLPQVAFSVVGELPPTLRSRVPSNVTLHGWLERNEVRALMQKARVYVQLSRHEGLPNALCEAMACGCIPVGSTVNGIPGAIGDTGFLSKDPCLDRDLISFALTMSLSDYARERARERIKTRFQIERRREALREVLRRFA